MKNATKTIQKIISNGFEEADIFESAPKPAYVAAEFARCTARSWAEERRPSGLSFGLRALDEEMIRMQNGELIIVAARPGMGKTALVTQAAVKVAQELKDDERVLFYSSEMTAEQIALRIAANMAEVNLAKGKNARLTAEEHERLQDALNVVANLKLIINDSTSPDTVQIPYDIDTMNEIGLKCRLIVVDYLELMEDSLLYNPHKEEEHQRVARITRRLKAVAKSYNLPVLVVSQVSRGVDDTPSKIPMPSHMSGSRWVEATADLLITMMRPGYYIKQGATCALDKDEDAEDAIYLNVLKNRHGEDKYTLRLKWEGEYAKIKDAPPPRRAYPKVKNGEKK